MSGSSIVSLDKDDTIKLQYGLHNLTGSDVTGANSNFGTDANTDGITLTITSLDG